MLERAVGREGSRYSRGQWVLERAVGIREVGGC